MALVSSDQTETGVPANLEAEQALLGVLLYDNDALHSCAGMVAAAHFYEPFHGRLFASIGSLVMRGRRADPVLLSEEFRRDPAFKELGGIVYLADLVDRAPPSSTAPDYATEVADKALRRDMIDIAKEMTRAAQQGYEDSDGARIDASHIAAEFERRMTAAQISSSTPILTDLDHAIDGVMAYVDDRTGPTGALTGLAPIDKRLGPLLPGDLILLAGRPSMGKSAVALAMGLNLAAPALGQYLNEDDGPAREPMGVIEVHAEMAWLGQTARRMMADVGYAFHGKDFPTYADLRHKKVSVEQRGMMNQVREQLAGVPIRGVKRSGLKISDLRALARRQIAQWTRDGVTPGLMIIDHVGLIYPDGRFGSRYEAQTMVAIALKALAEELGIPILALIQLSRDIDRRDDKRPQMNDMRDSGAWEENADMVLMAYRDSYYAGKEKEPDPADAEAYGIWLDRCRSKTIEILLPKVREGEPNGFSTLHAELPWNAIRSHEPTLFAAHSLL